MPFFIQWTFVREDCFSLLWNLPDFSDFCQSPLVTRFAWKLQGTPPLFKNLPHGGVLTPDLTYSILFILAVLFARVDPFWVTRASNFQSILFEFRVEFRVNFELSFKPWYKLKLCTISPSLWRNCLTNHTFSLLWAQYDWMNKSTRLNSFTPNLQELG